MNQYQPQKRQKNCWSDVVKSWPEEMIGEREGRKIGKETRMFFSSDAEMPICVHTRSSCNALTRTLAFQCLKSRIFGKFPAPVGTKAGKLPRFPVSGKFRALIISE
jgi:hypothetical protein